MVQPWTCIAKEISDINSFNFGMKVTLSTQDASKFKFDMSINICHRDSLILSIPVAEDYHTY